ncbi:MAG: GH3 auxin-responsive promoter family protein [Nannocystaceae bacterium]|nr:GH3 auxin-responsive promoter family protein [Nannocystaceae bacterium]
MTRELPAPARETALARTLEQLAPTRVGQRFGLAAIRSLADFRASVPIFDRDRHEREVETPLGFGVIDDAEAGAMSLAAAARERDEVLAVWRARLGNTAIARVASLHAHGADPLAERTLRDDVRALGGELLHLDRLDDAARVLERLRAFDPELLVVPSALTCTWLQRVQRAPLTRLLPGVRAVLCQHDLDRDSGHGVAMHSVGWFFRGLRCGLPSLRAPVDAITLAVGSQLLELLPYGNPEDDGRRVYADRTILPEQARLGHRYEIVVSSPLGLLRLRSEQHVRVVGFDPPTASVPLPRVRVVRLSTPPGDVALEGCTVAGAWLTASVRQALAREDPALVAAEIGADPQSLDWRPGLESSSSRLGDGFGETELTLRTAPRDRPGRPRALLCRIELQGFVRSELARKLAARIDENLRARSPAYAWLRQRDELALPRVIVLPAGTAASEQQRRVTELAGAVWTPDVRVLG